jgi:hypothetical protein
MSYNQWTRWLRAYDWREASLSFGHEVFSVAVRLTKNHTYVVHGIWWNSQFWLDKPFGTFQTFGAIKVDSDDNDWLIDILRTVIRGTLVSTESILLQLFKGIYPFKIDVITLTEAQRIQEVNHWLRKLDTSTQSNAANVAVLNVGDTIYMPKGVFFNQQYSVANDWQNDLTRKALQLTI